MLEGKDKDNNNLTFIRAVTVKNNNELINVDKIGHRYRFTIGGIESPLELTISHFGDK